MQFLRLSIYIAGILSSLIVSGQSIAATEQLAPSDKSPEEYEKIIDSQVNNQRILVKDLPSESVESKFSKAESIDYLVSHPTEFESLLSVMLTEGNAEGLKELLPYYAETPNYDPSVIDWGNAIIQAKQGNLNEAVISYRELNTRLPNVKVLRFQLALALFYNRQYEAARSEFEKLRSATTSLEDIQVINDYLKVINEQNRWNFNASASYIDDRNLNNAPEQGTQLIGSDGNSVTYTSPRESGKGFDYNLSGDKRWFYNNKIFTSLNLSTYGKYYWDNKNFNDLTLGIGSGIGFQNSITEVELEPFYNRRWYGGGRNGNGKLNVYADTTGINLKAKQWMSPKIRYQGLARYGKSSYVDEYNYNDGSDFLLANSVIYLPNVQQFWVFGADYSTKNANDPSSSFDRKGVRVGFGQTWPRGYSTSINFGYAKRNYEAADFFGIKRENKEYSTGLTLWNRGFSVLGLTPRLSWNYNKVNSNSPFEEYSKNNVSMEFTKDF